ncbi:MAG TPA: L-dopachrome tautomerase-related protein [Chthoniobacterales bacterium]
MHRLLAALVACFWFILSASAGTSSPTLEVVGEFPGQQVTGVAISREGRLFVNLPYWSEPHTVSVAEVKDGKLVPYPDEVWNQNSGDPGTRFVCVQSVYVDDKDRLWVVDPAAVKQGAVAKGGAKLVQIDLQTNRVVDAIIFDESVAPAKSYLNDVRIDSKHEFAFLTDSGAGALVVVDLSSRQARRVLADHPSTKAEPGLKLTVEGVPLVDPKNGEPVQVNSDGIAFDPDDGFLYYQALTGQTLYRIPAAALEDANQDDAALSRMAEAFGHVPAADGLWYDRGFLYSGALERDAIMVMNLETHELKQVLQDDRLHWPDSFAQGADRAIYVTTSQINLTPRFNHGQTRVQDPFRIFRFGPGN